MMDKKSGTVIDDSFENESRVLATCVVNSVILSPEM